MAVLNPGLVDLTDDDRQVLESWLVEFDQGWDEGLLANRLEQIPPGSSLRLPALAEMVKIDLQRQWQRGRQVSLESYLAEFPELGSPGDVSVDLIQAEYEVRRQFGVPVTLDDYIRRFPHQAGELARLIAQGSSALSRHASPAAASRSSSWGRKSAKAPELLPERFGRYRIIRRLGQGGMGSVYLAQDTHLERPVALKVPDFGNREDPEARRRFLEEARTAATLDHPYLCPVYDAGEIDGQPYLTMAYIEGQSLAALIGDAGWPQRQVAALVGKLALALQEAHTRKVVHRDLKPANVMIKTTGQRREPVIVDFGLAHRDNPQEQRLTKSGQVMGTLGYMAPEQIRGDLKEIGPASDIYALGVILYELLTGRLPFTGSGLAIAGQILTQAPLPPSAHRSDLDLALEAICLKAMAKTVGDRYTSMAELAAALTSFLQSPSPSSAAAPAGLPAAPLTALGERPPPVRSSSLVGQFLHQLAGTKESHAPIPILDPRASGAASTKLRRPAWPMILAVALLGVIVFGAIIYVAADQSRSTMSVSLREGETLKNESKPIRKTENTASLENDGGTAPKPGAGLKSSVLPKEITNTIGMKLAFIPAGKFPMGSPGSDMDAGDNEEPLHIVQMTRPFYIGIYEVTRGQFQRFVDETGYQTLAEKDGKGGGGWNEAKGDYERNSKYTWRNVGFEQTDLHPVVNVNWFDSVAFADWLSGKEGRTYRLPTEDEWEYACRAGTTTRYSCGDDPEGLAEVGNVADATAREKYPGWSWAIAAKDGFVYTSPVGSYRPNAWGLFDTHGNVFEWCFDIRDKDSHKRLRRAALAAPHVAESARGMVRGGSWRADLRLCRSAARYENPPIAQHCNLGFRVVMDQSETPGPLD